MTHPWTAPAWCRWPRMPPTRASSRVGSRHPPPLCPPSLARTSLRSSTGLQTSPLRPIGHRQRRGSAETITRADALAFAKRLAPWSTWARRSTTSPTCRAPCRTCRWSGRDSPSRPTPSSTAGARATRSPTVPAGRAVPARGGRAPRPRGPRGPEPCTSTSAARARTPWSAAPPAPARASSCRRGCSAWPPSTAPTASPSSSSTTRAARPSPTACALPHTVGLVTDLDARTSCAARSPRCAPSCATASTCSTARRPRTSSSSRAPATRRRPPSLVIVVDEFAALVKEVPEFVDGVVDVAQRGRSLGLHLILATQRPAGVIKDNLRANTNLRIALRMADEADSIRRARHADRGVTSTRSIPGRGAAKTGPGRLAAFQTGYAGGWTTDEPLPPGHRHRRAALRRRGRVGGAGRAEDAVRADRPGAERHRATRRIRSHGGSPGATIPAPRKPWLAELAPRLRLLAAAEPAHRRASSLLGVIDDAREPEPAARVLRPDRDGNMAVFGTGGSGKSATLRTIAAVARRSRPAAGRCTSTASTSPRGGLRMLESLPHVGAIIERRRRGARRPTAADAARAARGPGEALRRRERRRSPSTAPSPPRRTSRASCCSSTASRRSAPTSSIRSDRALVRRLPGSRERRPPARHPRGDHGGSPRQRAHLGEREHPEASRAAAHR